MHAGRDRHARPDVDRARRAAREDPRHRRGSRRRLRRALQHLPGILRAAARCEAARPAGEVGRHALRGIHRRRAGARHRAPRRDGARRFRPHPRHALRVPVQPGGLSRIHRQLREHGQPGERGERRLRRPGRPRAGEARADQHGSHRRLPRRGPAGQLLRDRAPGRPGRARARHGPRRVPPPQPRAEKQISVQDRHRVRIRLRRLRGRARQGAEGRGMEFIRREESAIPPPRQAARARHRHLHRGERRGRLRALRPGTARVGPRRVHYLARDIAFARPGPRNDVRADRFRRARRADGIDPAAHRRPGHAAGRQSHRRLALASGRGKRGADGVAGGREERSRARGGGTGGRASRRGVPGGQIPHQGHRPRGRAGGAGQEASRPARRGPEGKEGRHDVPQRLPHRRGRDRGGNRHRRNCPLRRLRRRRQHHQPPDRRRTDARRHHPGCRPHFRRAGDL